jgi:hypothetical protein
LEIEGLIFLICGNVGKLLIVLLVGNVLVAGLEGLVDTLDDLIDDKQACILVLDFGIL